MKKQHRTPLAAALGFLAAFILWTAAVCFADIQPIGPQGSSVGLAAINGCFHRLTGVHMALYVLTDWLSLIPLGFASGFALLGLIQWIRRRSLLKVDASLLLLGGFYVAVLAAYLFFEVFIVNYRPVLIEGMLEASYPSSTTVLTLCVMLTAILHLRSRIRHAPLRQFVLAAMAVFTAFMVAGRLLSGVHWLTDILGGALLSAGLILLYAAFVHPDSTT